MLEEEKRERFESVRLTRGIYHPQHRPTTFPAGRSIQGSKTPRSLHGVTQTEGAAHPRQLMASFTHQRQLILALNEKKIRQGVSKASDGVQSQHRSWESVPTSTKHRSLLARCWEKSSRIPMYSNLTSSCWHHTIQSVDTKCFSADRHG